VVAIKQISKQASIQDRCVFADVFSEIACLDAIRFEDHVCQLFDYGVDESGYWIVMKYYATTLRKWREMLYGSVSDNLPKLLRVFQQVLKAVHALHRHGVIHYDLKCDNVMIDPDRALDGDPGGICIPEARSTQDDGSLLSPGVRTSRDDQVPCIAVADFGESRMMANAEDLCVRNRGTECIKCPEMLEVEKVARKEGSMYDRRRGVGSNQAADVWSLGCLLFELLTGRYLFQDYDPATFFVTVTGQGADLPIVSEENIRLLDGNIPLVEYIRFLMDRRVHSRPSLAAALKRFDTVAMEALRCTDRHHEELPPILRRESTTSLDSPHSGARNTHRHTLFTHVGQN
jgi:serine/threonine protein kinase